MIIHVYTTVRNENYMIRYFLRHYLKFADKIFVWDDDSDDGTREILDSCDKVQVLTPEVRGVDNEYFSKLFSQAYREHSRGKADWVMVVDVDELHYHPDIINKLRLAQDLEKYFVLSEGYNMITDVLPSGDGQIYNEVTTGLRDYMYDRGIFSPQENISIGIGNHSYYHDDGKGLQLEKKNKVGIKLLHFRFLSHQYVKDRNQTQYERLTENNKKHGWGVHVHPNYVGAYSYEWYKTALTERMPCLDFSD